MAFCQFFLYIFYNFTYAPKANLVLRYLMCNNLIHRAGSDV